MNTKITKITKITIETTKMTTDTVDVSIAQTKNTGLVSKKKKRKKKKNTYKKMLKKMMTQKFTDEQKIENHKNKIKQGIGGGIFVKMQTI